MVFFTKVVLCICFMMLVRWTLPRIRYDQVLMLCWQGFIPISLVLVVATSLMLYFDLTAWWQILLMNVALGAAITSVAPRLLNKAGVNKRVPLAGSRFSPLPGASIATAPSDPAALDDDNPFARAGGRAPAP